MRWRLLGCCELISCVVLDVVRHCHTWRYGKSQNHVWATKSNRRDDPDWISPSINNALSLSTKVTSPLSFATITVDTRVPYHLPCWPSCIGISGFGATSRGSNKVERVVSASEVRGMVCLTVS